MPEKMTPETIATYVDHTLLKPQATPDQIDQLCAEARQYHFAAVCVNSHYVRRCAENLRDTGVQVASVVGFPLGAGTSASKAFEAEQAIEAGASEIDMVINIGELKAGNDGFVRRDIRTIVDSAHAKKAIVKVIIETCLLTDDEKRRACRAALEAGADFVKTSTGFSTGGATVEDVRLMRSIVGAKLGVKASGGVRTYEDAVLMIEAGANRLGTSAGVAIVQGAAKAASPDTY